MCIVLPVMSRLSLVKWEFKINEEEEEGVLKVKEEEEEEEGVLK